MDDDAAAVPCMWCTQSKRRCSECDKPLCAKHACARASGCCQPCIEAIHNTITLGRVVTTEAEEAELAAIGGPTASGYGELTPSGFRVLARHVRLSPDDIFVDLGSGLGRMCILAAREFHVAEAVGVELAKSRHQIALDSLDAENNDSIARKVRFLLGDVCSATIWATFAPTVAYANSVLFGPDLMRCLGQQIEACPSLRVVASTRPWSDGLNGFSLSASDPDSMDPTSTLRVESSWRAADELNQAGQPRDPGTPIYVYVRSKASASTNAQ